MPSAPQAPRPHQALWMVLGALLFASMGVCIKYASAHFGSAEIVGYRGLIGALFMWGLARARGISLHTRVPAMHAWRSVAGVTALLTWFYAIAQLPLATAMTLNYMSSIWVGAFLLGGALLLRPQGSDVRRQGPLFATVLCGFAGVAMVLRPAMHPEQILGALAGLMSGLVSALAYLQVSALARAGEPETRTVFYFSCAAAVCGMLGGAWQGLTPWQGHTAIWLLPIGVLAALGQLCMTRAYASGATLLVANLQYSGIVFAGLFGIVLLDEQLPWIGWLGMAVIVGSGITATILRERAVPRLPAEEHA